MRKKQLIQAVLVGAALTFSMQFASAQSAKDQSGGNNKKSSGVIEESYCVNSSGQCCLTTGFSTNCSGVTGCPSGTGAC